MIFVNLFLMTEEVLLFKLRVVVLQGVKFIYK